MANYCRAGIKSLRGTNTFWLRMCLCQHMEVEFEEEGDVRVGVHISVFVLRTVHYSS
jgi:hypothetical protein